MLLSSLNNHFAASVMQSALTGTGGPARNTEAAPQRQLAARSAYRAESSHADWTGRLQPATVEPGQTAELEFTVVPDNEWHVYAVREPGRKYMAYSPTTIAVQAPPGWDVSSPLPSSEPVEHPNPLDGEPPLVQHDGTVTWTLRLTVPHDAAPGANQVAGTIGFQTCSDSSCDMPAAISFTVPLTVADASDHRVQEVVFGAGGGYQSSVDLFANLQTAAAPVVTRGAAELDQNNTSVSYVVYVMGLAFLAGFILNFMPCVLPVIGLKILAFVQQAGENRGRILALNLWFSFGLMIVFMILATAAVFLKFGWGQHLQSVGFTLTLLSIVFVFALSFLGVWEIPIPGFAGGTKANQMAHKEGVGGAFFKGVLTTILATPCSGPLLVPTVSWAVGQPALITYMTFLFVGLGMASPYLVIGAFPAAVGFLPKPGPWMETFKQTMGFVLLGTVVFLFGTLDPEEYGVPILSLLLGLGLACWYIGRTPMTAALDVRLRAWGITVTMVAVSAWFSLSWMRSGVELQWQPFDRVALSNHLEEGRTVLIDFTANW
jgi:thiol:disulfide interchange protein